VRDALLEALHGYPFNGRVPDAPLPDTPLTAAGT
jgi:hypothetical protein